MASLQTKLTTVCTGCVHAAYVYRYDSDNPRVKGDVGMAGVAIDSVEDMKVIAYVSIMSVLLRYWQPLITHLRVYGQIKHL